MKATASSTPPSPGSSLREPPGAPDAARARFFPGLVTRPHPNPCPAGLYADTGHNSKVVFRNFLDMKLFPIRRLSTALDLTAGVAPPMFGSKGPTRISSNSAQIFPISYWNYMNIVIVESPAKAKTINKYLGSSYEVLASFGHVRDLPAKNGSVDPEANFQMIWEIDPKAAGRLNDIAKALKGADRLILATDPDREGEAISWHV